MHGGDDLMLGVSKDGLKSQVTKLLGDEEYHHIANVINNQIDQQASILDLAGYDYDKPDEISAEKIELALEEKGIEEGVELIIDAFDERQKTIQRQILLALDVDVERIKSEFP